MRREDKEGVEDKEWIDEGKKRWREKLEGKDPGE